VLNTLRNSEIDIQVIIQKEISMQENMGSKHLILKREKDSAGKFTHLTVDDPSIKEHAQIQAYVSQLYEIPKNLLKVHGFEHIHHQNDSNEFLIEVLTPSQV
jgi:hypothetical protein